MGRDEIALTGLKVFGHHGVYAREREEGQHFVVDLVLRLDVSRAAESDDVADTVHYGELAERVAAIVAGEPVNLIETLAGRIADEALRPALVESVRVTVRKPQAPIDLVFHDVSVSLERAKDAG